MSVLCTRPTRLLATMMAAVSMLSIALGPVAVAAMVTGTAGSDQLRGTARADTVHARAGNDIVWSLRGGDTVYGGPGVDRLETGPGGDLAFGGLGDDQVFGGPGDDGLSGAGDGDGHYDPADLDVLYGGPGRDFLTAADRMVAGDGADFIEVFGPGTNVVSAGRGNDHIQTYDSDGGEAEPAERDLIRCGEGFDTVRYLLEPDPTDELIGCERVR